LEEQERDFAMTATQSHWLNKWVKVFMTLNRFPTDDQWWDFAKRVYAAGLFYKSENISDIVGFLKNRWRKISRAQETNDE
jgi:hypothetical protein